MGEHYVWLHYCSGRDMTDGCTWFLDGWWRHCCEAHDFGASDWWWAQCMAGEIGWPLALVCLAGLVLGRPIYRAWKRWRG